MPGWLTRFIENTEDKLAASVCWWSAVLPTAILVPSDAALATSAIGGEISQKDFLFMATLKFESGLTRNKEKSQHWL